MARDKTINIDYLRSILSYDHLTGDFFWKVRGNKRIDTRRAGKIAGCIGGDGYKVIRIDGVAYYAHRLAWLHFYQKEIPADIDHINGNRSDNRISNLRVVTTFHNSQMKHKVLSSTGYMGVSWHKRDKKYQAAIKTKGKTIHLGYFDNPISASEAYQAKKREIDEGLLIYGR